jgi:hypothetical protein
MKYIFNEINEHMEIAFESAIPQGFSSTCNIAKKGFSGMRSSSPASISLHLDSDVLRIPFQAILPTLAVSVQKPQQTSKTNT